MWLSVCQGLPNPSHGELSLVLQQSPGDQRLINKGAGVKTTRLDLAKLIAEIGLVFGNWKQ